MKRMYLAALLSLAVVVPTTASQAAIVTRTFLANAVFTDGGPVTTAGFSFGITYDNMGGNFFNKVVDYYSTTSIYTSFNVQPVTFSLQNSTIFINGYGFGIDSFRPDFQLSLTQNGPNVTPPISFTAIYVVGDNTPFHTAGNQTLNTLIETTPSAVPEPASWAMLVAGFGVAGGALRQRRRTALA